MDLIIAGFHALQACLSAYTGLLSYTSIVKLQKYEEQSEQAAQYSNTAAHQLHKTRTTQASGAINTICSLASSVVLTGAVSSLSWRTTALVSVFNLAASGFAYKHMRNFWTAKAKIPFVTDYNDAITTSNQMLTALRALAISWGLSCLINAWQLAENKW